MRKRAKVQDKLEKLSVADALHAVDFAEVVVLLLDATRGLEAQDLRIADKVLQEGRALVIALNKWDVAENASVAVQRRQARRSKKGWPGQGRAAAHRLGARPARGIDKLLKVAFETREAWSRRVGTGELNRWFERAIEANPPPAPGGKRIKLRYVTQAKTRPPSFVLFGTRVDQLPDELSALSGQRHPPRTRLRRGAGAPDAARAEEPVRPMIANATSDRIGYGADKH